MRFKSALFVRNTFVENLIKVIKGKIYRERNKALWQEEWNENPQMAQYHAAKVEALNWVLQRIENEKKRV